jgi:hypothetical protein
VTPDGGDVAQLEEIDVYMTRDPVDGAIYAFATGLGIDNVSVTLGEITFYRSVTALEITEWLVKTLRDPLGLPLR